LAKIDACRRAICTLGFIANATRFMFVFDRGAHNTRMISMLIRAKHKAQFTTAEQRIALAILFAWMGESVINRSAQEYNEISSRIPKLEAVFAHVNAQLRRIKRFGADPFQICDFKAGDRAIWYRSFPRRISRETIRVALITDGWRKPKPRRRTKSSVT
jgi:hypothetical protein